jgi:hypothetical protein
MAKTVSKSGIVGPFGLRITSGSLTRFSTPTSVTVNPSYLDSAGAKISNAKAKATAFNLYFGGSLSELPAPEQKVASGDVVWAFDSAPIDNKLDSFYLNAATINLPSITALGVVADNVTIKVKDLSNNPELLQLKGLAAGSWLGSITLSGSKLSLPFVPNLTFTPKATAGDAFSATYHIDTGNVLLDLAKVEYASPMLTVSLSESQLVLVDSTKTASFRGLGQLSLPGLGLNKVSTQFDLKVVDGSLDSLQSLITPGIASSLLGLSGSLKYDHNFKTGAGTFSVSNGELLGISGVHGYLSYGPTSISGSLDLNLNKANKPLSLTAGGLSLTPIKGSVNLDYAWGGAKSGGTLDFKDVLFNVGLGGKNVSFLGDVNLALAPDSSPTLRSASLRLDSDLDINIGGFNLRLLAKDPVAPTKLSLVNSNGVLVPQLSGKAEFSDLGGFQVSVPDGGISYGVNGWSINDLQFTLGQNVDLGPVRLGSQASARYQNGKVTLNPDMSVNLDTFSLALKPIGQLVTDVVTPITAPIVDLFTTNIDLASVDSVRKIMDTLKQNHNFDLPNLWSGLVEYLEMVPGNPYQDKVLTAGELLDFVCFQAFDYVQQNPAAANAAFKEIFNADLPDWLLNLPQGIDYADISMSATIARLDNLNKLAASLLEPTTASNQWVSVPMTIELGASSTKPQLSGGGASEQALEAQLRQLNPGLQKLDQLTQDQAPAAVRNAKTLPLKFNYDFSVPLYDDPINTILKLISNKPFDVVRSDFSLSSGAELAFGVEIEKFASFFPPAKLILKAIDLTVELRAGIEAQLALSLGLTSSAPSLLDIGKDISSNLAQTPAALLRLFSSRDPLTGNALGLYVGQTQSKPLLQFKPYIQAGINADLFGAGVIDVGAYARADGTVNVNLTNADEDNRAYLSDVLTGTTNLPGLRASASINGTVGYTSFLGDDSYAFPILTDATLFDTSPASPSLSTIRQEPLLLDLAGLVDSNGLT